MLKFLLLIELTQSTHWLVLDLELCLQSFEKELTSSGLPQPTQKDLLRVESVTSLGPVVIREEMDYDRVALEARVQDVIPIFTHGQAEIFKNVLQAVKEEL